MKKTGFMLAIAAIVSISSAYAQNKSNDASYHVGDNVVSAGIGLGSSINGYGSTSSTPAFSLQYERGLVDAGPGVISGGLYVGYKSFKYSDADVSEKWNYTIIGLRGAYHYTGLNVENLDLYGGLMLSYDHLKYSWHDNGGFGEPPTGYSGYGNGNVELTAFIGARYYFVSNLAVFAELGYGVADANIGLAFRF